MPPTFTAWYMRELTTSQLHLKTRGYEREPFVQSRGIPQGNKWSPQLYKTVLAWVLQPVWDRCQRQQIGLPMLEIRIPFLSFSDNMFILATTGDEFDQILTWIREALQGTGWSIPDDRVEYQTNKFVDGSRLHRLNKYQRRHLPVNFKCLGCLINVNGNTFSDVQYKTMIMKSARSMRWDLWTTRKVPRKNKLDLMHKVATGTLNWCVGAWKIHQKAMRHVKGNFDAFAKKHQQLPRLQHETDKEYGRRNARLLATTKRKLKQATLDRVILTRQYDYIGHVMRFVDRNPTCLLRHILENKDKLWKVQHQHVFSFQGHQHRVPPWNWEYQFDDYFSSLGVHWGGLCEKQGKLATTQKRMGGT